MLCCLQQFSRVVELAAVQLIHAVRQNNISGICYYASWMDVMAHKTVVMPYQSSVQCWPPHSSIQHSGLPQQSPEEPFLLPRCPVTPSLPPPRYEVPPQTQPLRTSLLRHLRTCRRERRCHVTLMWVPNMTTIQAAKPFQHHRHLGACTKAPPDGTYACLVVKTEGASVRWHTGPRPKVGK